MSRLFPPLILFILVVLQGANFLLIPDILPANGFTVVIHGVFVFLVLIGLYYDQETTYHGFLYAIISGLMMDIVYANIIGVYMFSYAVTLYLVHYLRKILHVNFYVSSFVFFLAISLMDFLIFELYRFIGVISLTTVEYFEQRLLMTLAVNYVVFLIQFVLFKRLLTRYSLQRFEQK
ncbi:rod shape-determining protein MreD [Halolactibacillus alkaliphilus]|uniref:rod shape-determining protein MreD n=1 Tax=Halolactibacillus alkaliphilus TaxID=442899 RepID=UPI0008E20967|nr:rod shape-determining protein MreD [Halolactibacillus alkaliphilus]SFO69602.1 rod shape-determining protein MreD [Halolactibacillus alkaliphilus]